MTKENVLELLMRNAGSYVSGQNLAKELGVSRAMVWKAIEQLRAEGYSIESVTNRGYMLRSGHELPDAELINSLLETEGLDIRVFRTITSTNTVLKGMAAEGAPEGVILIADSQSAGRGRMGRSFFSPAGTGLYMSFLLRPQISASEATNITSCAAVAVAEALESVLGISTGIKWVNDVIVDGRKVCGILTEASVDCETGTMNYVIPGIGINILTPEGGFPEEIRDIAGAVADGVEMPALRSKIAAAVIDRFFSYYRDFNSNCFYEAYRSRSVTIGKAVNILRPGSEPEPAEALDIGRDFALIVRTPSGEIKNISSGEVSIRPRN